MKDITRTRTVTHRHVTHLVTVDWHRNNATYGVEVRQSSDVNPDVEVDKITVAIKAGGHVKDVAEKIIDDLLDFIRDEIKADRWLVPQLMALEVARSMDDMATPESRAFTNEVWLPLQDVASGRVKMAA